MKGIFFSEDEIGEKTKCGMCGHEDSEGVFIESNDEKELEFLESKFGDRINWCVNSCCQEKFARNCSTLGFEFGIHSGLPLKTVFAY